MNAMADDVYDAHERPTVRICVVCLGRRLIERKSVSTAYGAHICMWCTDGVMSNPQYFHWRLMVERGKVPDSAT